MSSVPSLSHTQEPSGELPPVEPELFDQARRAVSAIRGRGRRANGTAGAGNTIAVRHGLRSSQLLEQPDIATWHAEQVAAIEADLGGASQLSALQRGMTREAARVEVILSSLGDELLAGGVLTAKGKARAHLGAYMKVLDRYVNLAKALGLRRVPRPVPTFAQYLDQRAADGTPEDAA